MFIRCEVSSSLMLTTVSLFVRQTLGAVKSGFHLGISFPLYKGTCIDRTHKGRGSNYDLRIRKQTGADSHVLEALR